MLQLGICRMHHPLTVSFVVGYFPDLFHCCCLVGKNNISALLAVFLQHHANTFSFGEKTWDDIFMISFNTFLQEVTKLDSDNEFDLVTMSISLLLKEGEWQC